MSRAMRGLPHFFFRDGYWWVRCGNRYYGGWSRIPVGERFPPSDGTRVML